MSDHTSGIEDAPSGAPNETVDQSRRKLTGAALGASAIFTLASRPVWANQCTISGMASGNLSSPGEVVCAGCSSTFWLNHPEDWPTDYSAGACAECVPGNKCNSWNDDGTPFPFPGISDYTGKTMMQVLAEDPAQLGGQAVAALLNSVANFSGASFGYSPGDIGDLWAKYAASSPESLRDMFLSLNGRFCPLGDETEVRQCTEVNSVDSAESTSDSTATDYTSTDSATASADCTPTPSTTTTTTPTTKPSRSRESRSGALSPQPSGSTSSTTTSSSAASSTTTSSTTTAGSTSDCPAAPTSVSPTTTTSRPARSRTPGPTL